MTRHDLEREFLSGIQRRMDVVRAQMRLELNRELFAVGELKPAPPVPRWRVWRGRVAAYVRHVWWALRGRECECD